MLLNRFFRLKMVRGTHNHDPRTLDAPFRAVGHPGSKTKKTGPFMYGHMYRDFPLFSTFPFLELDHFLPQPAHRTCPLLSIPIAGSKFDHDESSSLFWVKVTKSEWSWSIGVESSHNPAEIMTGPFVPQNLLQNPGFMSLVDFSIAVLYCNML